MTILGADETVDGGQRGRDAKRCALPNRMGACMLSSRVVGAARPRRARPYRPDHGPETLGLPEL